MLRRDSVVEVAVSDEGIGIAPEDMRRLFKRFGRAVPEGCRISGTGLGLYSVMRTAEAHGGTVRVTSKPGVGSTFTVVLSAEIMTAGESDDAAN
ncbi:MAG: ATP-binding protein [Armatimonadetes bacterium]|nr:ATP-binding protein [Armatimonadota bacterium]